jgi:hypothetical protein
VRASCRLPSATSRLYNGFTAARALAALMRALAALMRARKAHSGSAPSAYALHHTARLAPGIGARLASARSALTTSGGLTMAPKARWSRTCAFASLTSRLGVITAARCSACEAARAASAARRCSAAAARSSCAACKCRK